MPRPPDGKRIERATPHEKKRGWLKVELEDGSKAEVHKDLAERIWPRRASIIVPELPWKRGKEQGRSGS